MLAEVSYGVVDTSIASFSLNLERIKLADFSQYIVSPIQTIVMKRPVKSEQISYYTRKYQSCHNSDDSLMSGMEMSFWHMLNTADHRRLPQTNRRPTAEY